MVALKVECVGVADVQIINGFLYGDLTHGFNLG